jgi:hypothetical protein
MTSHVGLPAASYAYKTLKSVSSCCTTLMPQPFSPRPAHHMSLSGFAGAFTGRRCDIPRQVNSMS